MPKRKARSKSSARRQQRPPSEWKVLGRYLRQMTGYDLDRYAHLVAVLKERFARLEDRDTIERLITSDFIQPSPIWNSSRQRTRLLADQKLFQKVRCVAEITQPDSPSIDLGIAPDLAPW